MKITHHMPNPGPTRRGFRVLLIGCGGNGSAVLFGLPYLHHALIAWGFTDGLQVTVMDADTVSPTNCVRQPFGSADIGQNKATDPYQPRQSLSRTLMAVGRDILHEGCPEQHRQQL